ncbi:MAG: hypothetical protein QNI84_06090 [Henriciella sp.]|nr:hypothetical protein [Henriciella sp.]
MKAVSTLCLLMAVSLFAVHEMDAMTHSEWLLLPLLGEFTEATGRDIFLLLHIPLYLGLFWALFYASWRKLAALIFCGALIVHGTAHGLLSGHELYTFVAPTETITVYGAVLVSVLYVALDLLARRR